MPVQTIIQTRRDTAAQWTSVNPVLAAGEQGYETDTLKFKVGNGSSTWTALSYAGGGTGGTEITTQSGTSYTLASTDVSDLIKFTSATAVTVTIPPTSTGGWSSGNSIDMLQMSTGQVSVVAGAGVTIRTAGLLKTRDQYSAITVVYIGTDEWLLQGDTAVI